MTPEVFTGDTKTLKVTFTNKVAEGEDPGTPEDPDSQECFVTIYNVNEKVILTGTGVREATGVYNYDWTAPLHAGFYWVEFKGLFNGKPGLMRKKYNVKFRGDQ